MEKTLKLMSEEIAELQAKRKAQEKAEKRELNKIKLKSFFLAISTNENSKLHELTETYKLYLNTLLANKKIDIFEYNAIATTINAIYDSALDYLAKLNIDFSIN